jgi:putative ABC transport system permease protein
MMKTFLQDLRYAVRMFRRSPAFAAIAIGTLALGIGANTAIFSLVRAVLLEPLPFADAERVVNVMEVWKGNRGSVSAGMLADLRRDSRSFDRLAAARYANMNLAVGDEAERVVAARVTHEFFSVFGVAPSLGRVFRPEEDRPSGERVAVLSHRLWTARLGGAPDVLGQPLRLNGEVYTIVGVMPKAFDYARDNEELWIPAALTAEVLANHDNHNLVVTGLLRPSVTLAEAQAEASAIMVQIRKAFPQEASERDFRIQPMREVLVENYSDRLWILFGAVGLVLLIACINVSNMLLARGTLRQREITVRSAVGASRGRIARQLFTENLALGLAGGALGVLAASAAVGALIAASPGDVPRIESAGIDGTVLGFALLVSVVSAILFGLAPVVRTTRGDLQTGLRESGRGLRGGPRDRVRALLVAGQIALVLPLLAGAGLLIRTALHLQRVDPGFDPRGVLSARVSLPRTDDEDPRAVSRTLENVVEELERSPGVASAALTTQVPLGPGGNSNGLIAEAATLDVSKAVDSRLRIVTAAYLRTMGIPLLRGRGFDARDVDGAQRVMIVSDSLGRRLWPGEEAIGKRVACCEGSPEDPMWKTVVGIAADTRSRGLGEDVYPEFYLPIGQAPREGWEWLQRTVTLVAKAQNGDPATLAAPMRAAVQAVAPGVPAYDLRTMADRLRESLAQERFATLLLVALGIVGLVLAAVGIYGIVSYFVAARTAEFGVRIALGATARDIVLATARHGLPPVALGLAAGVATALAATRWLRATLRGVTPSDPATFAAVVVVLAAVAALAMWAPARRAARIDPSRALRSE